MRERIFRFLVLCGVAGLSGCADPISVAPEKSVGILSFRYESASPDFNGSFAARGFPRLQGQSGPWAGGVARGTSQTEIHAVAGDPTPGGVFITVKDLVTGTAHLDPECTSSCNRMVITLSDVGAGRETYACEMSEGVLAIRLRTKNRVRGNFSGTGTCWSSATAERPAIRVTDGMFDVGLLRED
ncbi:hypothetical protein [Longimicrobium terrae]|uniref:Lipoprotein n=1 Tax=Longimicrobium terrae TaxID=1639882 RepID=A0A841GYP9_9BACT|nr:hypothetical protein [Longimicrobium terrae]MBB4636612.1 hypothetical protein [Longimicrobium terrae]MBB6070864.1 hypothetical protein [Longimicrobium terrae]NNC28889.1 hypothetical protein [Longimicrobium terrae]